METIYKQCGKYELEDYQAEIKVIIEKARNDYEVAKNELIYYSKLQEDLLHDIENKPMNAVEMAKWASQMKQVRKKRRESRVLFLYLQPFICLINNPTYQGSLNDGLLNKNRLWYNDQPYKPRVKEDL